MKEKFDFIESFQIKGVVEKVLVASQSTTHISVEVPHISTFINEGIKGDNHSGRRLADVREEDFLRFGLSKRTEIANHRHFSAISVEEMREIAQAMNIPAIPIGALGENIIISGIPHLTLLPIGTKLFFKNKSVPQTAVLLVSGENTPCHIPGKAIQEAYSNKVNLASLFPKVAIHKRGVVGSIFCSGRITIGDEVTAVIPKRYAYPPIMIG